MFLAATPYFRARFTGNEWIQTNFLSAILLLSCLTNVSFVFALARLQKNASYPRRISLSLLINIITFALLALSTQVFTHTSPGLYFAFVLATVLSSSWATGLCQNGVFAYASGFGNPKYMQGIMTGQAVAGVLPCIARMLDLRSFSIFVRGWDYLVSLRMVLSHADLACLWDMRRDRHGPVGSASDRSGAFGWR
jgi:equilibrative nucleoside transporter 1/2/3